jgi:hypothetical protein
MNDYQRYEDQIPLQHYQNQEEQQDPYQNQEHEEPHPYQSQEHEELHHYQNQEQEQEQFINNNMNENFYEENSQYSSKKAENIEYFIDDDNNTLITENTNIFTCVSNILKGDESVAESKVW